MFILLDYKFSDKYFQSVHRYVDIMIIMNFQSLFLSFLSNLGTHLILNYITGNILMEAVNQGLPSLFRKSIMYILCTVC